MDINQACDAFRVLLEEQQARIANANEEKKDSCIGEGNGNPLQCSCLENPGDRGAWWASVYEVTQSRT